MTASARRHAAKESGFTLVELLIVVVILGILAGITVFAVSNFTSNGVDSACQADYKTVQVAMESFKAEESSYPNLANQPWLGNYSTFDAVPGLLNKDPNNGLGPWLLSPTTNGQHYRIEGKLDGSGTVLVMAWNDTNGTNIIGDGAIDACSQVH
jgi:general secretion pathway protein G